MKQFHYPFGLCAFGPRPQQIVDDAVGRRILQSVKLSPAILYQGLRYTGRGNQPVVFPLNRLLHERHLIEPHAGSRAGAKPEGMPQVVFWIPPDTDFPGNIQLGWVDLRRQRGAGAGDEEHGLPKSGDRLHLSIVLMVGDESQVNFPPVLHSHRTQRSDSGGT